MCERDAFWDTARQGEQLVKASKQLEAWDFDGVLEASGKKGIQWHLVPIGDQHLKELMEHLSRILKKQMQWSFEGRRPHE